MVKKTAGQGAQPPKFPLPRTLQRATIAGAVQIGLSLVTVALFWGFDSGLTKLITDNNAHAKKPQALCTDTVTKNCLDVVKSLHSFRTGITEYTIIASAILVFLIFLMRRGSGAGRWIYLIASVFAYQVGFAGSPMSLFVLGTATPAPLKVVQTLAGAASIVAIVFLMMPASADFFRKSGAALREARGQGAAPRPGLFGSGGLFGPRPPARTGVVKADPGPEPDPEAARARSRSKSRADAESIAKGADLARARAKASKSRRPVR